MAAEIEGWSAEELARMKQPGAGALSEPDGRSFMLLLDMCHYLTDTIVQEHNFKDLGEYSRLRQTDQMRSWKLTAQMYTYWESAPAGDGVYKRLLQYTQQQQDASSQPNFDPSEVSLGGTRSNKEILDALHQLARSECVGWKRAKLNAKFYYAGEASSGAALLTPADMTDPHVGKVFEVTGISTSLGDVVRSGGREPLGQVMNLTLLPFMGRIVYDGAFLGCPAPREGPALLAELAALAKSAIDEGTVITALEVPFIPVLVGERVTISGLTKRPDLNGSVGTAASWDGEKRRYAVVLDGAKDPVAIKPANLALAADDDAMDAPPAELSAFEREVQKRLKKLATCTDKSAGFWTFRRMGYTEVRGRHVPAVRCAVCHVCHVAVPRALRDVAGGEPEPHGDGHLGYRPAHLCEPGHACPRERAPRSYIRRVSPRVRHRRQDEQAQAEEHRRRREIGGRAAAACARPGGRVCRVLPATERGGARGDERAWTGALLKPRRARACCRAECVLRAWLRTPHGVQWPLALLGSSLSLRTRDNRTAVLHPPAAYVCFVPSSAIRILNTTTLRLYAVAH